MPGLAKRQRYTYRNAKFPVILEIVKRAVDEDGETLSQTDPDIEDSADSRRELALALLNHVMEKLDELVRSRSYRRRLM